MNTVITIAIIVLVIVIIIAMSGSRNIRTNKENEQILNTINP